MVSVLGQHGSDIYNSAMQVHGKAMDKVSS